MEVDPTEYVNNDDEGDDKSGAEKRKSQLNTAVAITVALLATFMGICGVKDNNIAQGMQQAQADKIDSYSWYQARNIREEVAKATVAQLTVAASAAPPAAQSVYQQQIAAYEAIAKEQGEKKKTQQEDADKADKTYNQLNFRDDQFDLSDALLSIAISLLAGTALTQKRWLFALAMIPTAFGLLMGLAGLFGWNIHPDALTRMLS